MLTFTGWRLWQATLLSSGVPLTSAVREAAPRGYLTPASSRSHSMENLQGRTRFCSSGLKASFCVYSLVFSLLVCLAENLIYLLDALFFFTPTTFHLSLASNIIAFSLGNCGIFFLFVSGWSPWKQMLLAPPGAPGLPLCYMLGITKHSGCPDRAAVIVKWEAKQKRRGSCT